MDINYWYKKGKDLIDEIDVTKLPENMIAIWFLGQEGLVVKNGDTMIYIDPFLSDVKDDKGVSRRRYLPPFDPAEIHHADWVLCTHNHSDHIDPKTLTPMAIGSPGAKFVVPAPHVSVLEKLGIDSSRIIAGRQREKLALTPSISVLPIPSAHEEYRIDDHGDHLFLGYLLNLNGIKLYHAGDTVETEELVETLRYLQIDIACLPINGADWKRRRKNIIGNMNARDAANVAADCGIDLIIPLHYDVFPLNGENPAYFVDNMYRFYPDKKFHIMAPGERFIYMK